MASINYSNLYVDSSWKKLEEIFTFVLVKQLKEIVAVKYATFVINVAPSTTSSFTKQFRTITSENYKKLTT